MPAQRWRLILARSATGPDLSQREQGTVWAAALGAAGLDGGPEASRIVFAAPMPAGMSADADLADLFLPQRRTLADVRARLAPKLPDGYRLVDLHDDWVGEPALPGQVVAGDYRVRVVRGPGTPLLDDAARDLGAAVPALLAASTIERVRRRPDRPAGNLRPLVDVVRVLERDRLWMRLRFDPALGTGRPEEVVAALAVLAGRSFMAQDPHRERLWLRAESTAGGV
jgi:hypothetical protein